MNTFDAQGNYIDEKGKIIKRVYSDGYWIDIPKTDKTKVNYLSQNFDFSKIFRGLKNASETGQEIETGRSSDPGNG